MEGFQHFHHNNWYRRLLEIGAKLVLDPRVGLWALLAGVQVPLLPQLPGGSCIKIGLPGKSILEDYFQENRTSRRPYLLLRISFPGRPIFIQFIPGLEFADVRYVAGLLLDGHRGVARLPGREVLHLFVA